MLATHQVACPNCSKSLKLASPPTVGKRLRCPQCGCPWSITAEDVGATPPPVAVTPPRTMPAVTQPAMTLGVSRLASPPPLPMTEEPPENNRGLMIAGIIGGLVLLLGTATGLAFFFGSKNESSSKASTEPKKETRDVKKELASASTTIFPLPDTRDPKKEPDDRKPDDRPVRDQPDEVTVRPDRPNPTTRPADEPMRDPPRPVVAPLPTGERTTLTPEEQEKVNKAIDRGVAYLKKTQTRNGDWGGDKHHLGHAALSALTLLECGVKADDPGMKLAIGQVRHFAPTENQTYDIALAILFLDRLGDKSDEPLIRSLGLRLIAGQKVSGGWTYNCAPINPNVEPRLLLALEKTRPLNTLELFVSGKDGRVNPEFLGLDSKSGEFKGLASKLDPDAPFRGAVDGASKLEVPPPVVAPGPNEVAVRDQDRRKEMERVDAAKRAINDLPPALKQIPSLLPPSMVQGNQIQFDGTDNSNTQFAILGVLGSTRHGVPTERALGMVVHRFRSTQDPDGAFHYHMRGGGDPCGPSTMTAAGLLGLAVTHGLTAGTKIEGMGAKAVNDQGIQKGLKFLSGFIGQPVRRGGPKQRQPVNLYFMWSVERVGVLYSLPKINDKDWYLWGVEQLLELQQPNGNWQAGGYPGSNPNVDTCFALLFLKRANFAKDLTNKIQSKLELIIDDK
jgi:hypothetical protein